MRDATDKVMFVFYGMFGALLGLLIFMFGLGGWPFVFMGKSTRPWNGLWALVACCVLGGGWGFIAYIARQRELGSSGSSLFSDQASAVLFSKRLMVIATCVAGLYFIWQIAKSI